MSNVRMTLTITDATPAQAAAIARIMNGEQTGAHLIDQTLETSVDNLRIARKFLGYVRRHASQMLIIDALLEGRGEIPYAKLVEAHGGKGGPSLAGCLSSITKNFQRSGGEGKFFKPVQADDNSSWTYTIDKEFVEPLARARADLRAKQFTVRIPSAA